MGLAGPRGSVEEMEGADDIWGMNDGDWVLRLGVRLWIVKAE